jgi:hypothetical protein
MYEIQLGLGNIDAACSVTADGDGSGRFGFAPSGL